jgi:arabinose-5-phosphate isomerase
MSLEGIAAERADETTVHDVARRTLALEIAGLETMSAALAGPLGAALALAVDTIRAAEARGGRVIVTGMGKSGHVGRKIAATLASTGTPSYFVHPSEASHGDLGMVRGEDVVLALSWSGEAPELSDIVAYTRRFSVPLVAITSRPTSALGAAADVLLLLPQAQEACPNGLAPTTSTTMQIALGDALAVALLTLKGFTATDFRAFHPGGKLGAQLRKVRDLMHGGDAVPLVGEDTGLSDTIMEMTGKRFGVTGVVDEGGNLVGVVTDGDLRRAFRSGLVDQPARAVMTRRPQTIGPDALASAALALINRAAITSLFVVEGPKPIGILHIHDLLRAGTV